MQRLTIGAFSRLTHLSIKTLRYYHEVGLLEPAVIDPDSGYRYYRPGQAHSAHLVRRFRDLGLPVADVKAVLAAPDLTARDAILAGHLDRMRDQLRQTEAAVESLRRMLEGGSTALKIDERVLEGGPTISVAADLMRADVTAWWWDALAGLRSMATAAGLSRPARWAACTTMSCSRRTPGTPGSTCRSGTRRRSTARARAGSCPPAGSPSRCTPAPIVTSTAPTPRSARTPPRTAATARPVRERYLADPLDTPDNTQWQTEVCWPLATAAAPAN